MKGIISYLKHRFSGSPKNTPKPMGALSPEFIQKYGLSTRQVDVTQIMLLGKSDREIAAILEIDLNTVKSHLKAVYRKTGMRGRYALMVLVGVGGQRRNEE
jgi:DNA-binding CsgD family transcriptional regulator